MPRIAIIIKKKRNPREHELRFLKLSPFLFTSQLSFLVGDQVVTKFTFSPVAEIVMDIFLLLL